MDDIGNDNDTGDDNALGDDIFGDELNDGDDIFETDLEEEDSFGDEIFEDENEESIDENEGLLIGDEVFGEAEPVDEELNDDKEIPDSDDVTDAEFVDDNSDETPDQEIKEPDELTNEPLTDDQEWNEETEEEVEEETDNQGRKPINYEYADSVYSFEDKNPDLHEKYPEGVQFDNEGYPDFSPYAETEVTIDMQGDHYHDYKAANEAADKPRTPDGFTWHHHQDGKTMQLVPTDLHGEVRHTGGVSIVNNQNK